MSNTVPADSPKKAVDIAFSGSIPQMYDQYLGPFMLEVYAKDMARRVKSLNAGNVLELACGTGRVTKNLVAAISPESKLTATDINPAMLEFAKQQVSAPNLSWGLADAGALEFKDESFDAVVCQFGIMFVPDKVQAYTQAYRVLTSRGSLIVNTWDSFEYNPIVQMFHHELESFFKEDTPKFMSIPFSYTDESLMREQLSSAGFSDISIEVVPLEGRSPSAQEAARGFVEGNPSIVELKARGDEAVKEINSRLTKAIIERYGDGEISVPFQARVITARKT